MRGILFFIYFTKLYTRLSTLNFVSGLFCKVLHSQHLDELELVLSLLSLNSKIFSYDILEELVDLIRLEGKYVRSRLFGKNELHEHLELSVRIELRDMLRLLRVVRQNRPRLLGLEAPVREIVQPLHRILDTLLTNSPKARVGVYT